MKGALRGHFELEIFEVFALDPAFVGFRPWLKLRVLQARQQTSQVAAGVHILQLELLLSVTHLGAVDLASNTPASMRRLAFTPATPRHSFLSKS